MFAVWFEVWNICWEDWGYEGNWIDTFGCRCRSFQPAGAGATGSGRKAAEHAVGSDSYARIYLRQVAQRRQGQEALPAGSRSLDPQMQQRDIPGLTRARHGSEGRTAPVSERLQIPSARKPAQAIIKLSTITARKLEEAKSSRIMTPGTQSVRSPGVSNRRRTFAIKPLGHRFVSGCLRRPRKTTSSRRPDCYVPDASRSFFTEPRARRARRQALIAALTVRRIVEM